MCTVYSFVYVSLYKISIKLRNSLILLHTLNIFIHTSSMTSTSHNELHFRRAWCYRLSTVPDSIVDNITVKYFRGSIFLLSLGTFPTITCLDKHGFCPCFVYTVNALCQSEVPNNPYKVMHTDSRSKGCIPRHQIMHQFMREA